MYVKTLRQEQEKAIFDPLDELLRGRGLQRVPVARDGNCLFTAVLHQWQQEGWAGALRSATKTLGMRPKGREPRFSYNNTIININKQAHGHTVETGSQSKARA